MAEMGLIVFRNDLWGVLGQVLLYVMAGFAGIGVWSVFHRDRP